MILVRIEYREDLMDGLTPQQAHDELLDMRDYIESVTGKVFEEELANIDISLHCFGVLDLREEAIMITVEIPEEDVHHDLKRLTEEYQAILIEYIDDLVGKGKNLRVWVQRVSGEVAEIWVTKQ